MLDSLICVLRRFSVLVIGLYWWLFRGGLVGYTLSFCVMNGVIGAEPRPDTTFLWFLMPLKAIRHLVCNQYKWLVIKIVVALLLFALLGLFLYSMPGYMVKKLLGA